MQHSHDVAAAQPAWHLPQLQDYAAAVWWPTPAVVLLVSEMLMSGRTRSIATARSGAPLRCVVSQHDQQGHDGCVMATAQHGRVSTMA